MVVRILIWGLFESKTTIDELRDSLPELEEPSVWVWNEASERFGAVIYGDDPYAPNWFVRAFAICAKVS